MINALYGTILLVGSGGAFWRLLPDHGVPHPLAVAPYLQVMIPIAITAGVTFGVGLLVSGLMGFNPF